MSLATTGIDRIAEAFGSHGKRAALMPYLMGGYPSLDASADAGLAAAAAGADLIELGIPFSDPLADGPVIHAAGTEALAGGATPHGALRVCERISEQVPVVLMVYVNVVMTAGAGGVRAAGGVVRRGWADRARPAPRRGRRGAGRLRRARAWRWCRWWRRRPRPSESPRSAPARAASSTRCRSTGTTGERESLPPGLAETVARVRGATEAPVAVGFGISLRGAGKRGGGAGGRGDRRQPDRARGRRRRGRGGRDGRGGAGRGLAVASRTRR